MYNNDAKFQTDYEYNHSLDAYMQQSYKMPYQPKSLNESLAILKEYKDTQLSHINFSKNTSKNQSNKAHK